MKCNIVFATDENYVEYLAVALFSLLDNNKDLDFNIYIINGGIKKSRYDKLETLVLGFKCKLINIEINDKLFENLVTNHHFTKANYYRLLIPNLINVDLLLYLDADIIVKSSIKKLYNTKLNNHYVGAVLNPGFDRHENLQMDKEADYFNSGVILINNKLWREKNLTENVIDFIEKNEKQIQFVDQCGLNAIINGNWEKLSLRYNQQAVIFEDNFQSNYNCFSVQDLEEAKIEPVIIHYTGSSKPWHFRNKHPYKSLWWEYQKMTPFKRYIPEDLVITNIIRKIIPSSIKKFIKKVLRKKILIKDSVS